MSSEVNQDLLILGPFELSALRSWTQCLCVHPVNIFGFVQCAAGTPRPVLHLLTSEEGTKGERSGSMAPKIQRRMAGERQRFGQRGVRRREERRNVGSSTEGAPDMVGRSGGQPVRFTALPPVTASGCPGVQEARPKSSSSGTPGTFN